MKLLDGDAISPMTQNEDTKQEHQNQQSQVQCIFWPRMSQFKCKKYAIWVKDTRRMSHN
jgi:hypothetical protein